MHNEGFDNHNCAGVTVPKEAVEQGRIALSILIMMVSKRSLETSLSWSISYVCCTHVVQGEV